MTGEAAIRINENSVIRESIYGKRIRSTDVILTGIIYGCASLSMLLLIGILGYTFVRGVPHVTWSFLSTGFQRYKGNLWYPWKYYQHSLYCSDHSADRNSYWCRFCCLLK